jgi:hypothetical protein
MDDDPVSTTAVTAAAAEAPVPPTPRTRTRDATAGVVAVLAALGASELVAALLGAQSMVASVGEWVIDHQPPGAKDFVVSIFGTNDKLALEILIVAVALLIGAAVGIVARRSFAAGALTIAAFAAIGFLASLDDPSVSAAPQAVVAGVAGFAGIETLSWLLAWAVPRAADRGATTGSMPDWSRRSFLIRAGSVAAASVVAGVLGRQLLDAAGGPPAPAARPCHLPPRPRRCPAGRRSTSTASPRSSCPTTASTGSTPRC